MYDNLRTKSELTAKEKDTLAQVSENLISKLGIEASAIKDVDGKYKDLTSSIEEYIKKAHQRVELSIIESGWEATAQELENTKQELKQKLKEKGYSEDEVLDAAGAGIVNQYKEKSDLLEEKIKEYKGQYDSILRGAQESQEMMIASEALSAKESTEIINKSTQAIQNKTNTTKKSTEEEKKAIETTGELANTLSDMTAKTNAVTSAENEYNESKKLTVSTLQAVIDKYPELEDEVYKYMMGLEDAKTLINSMKNVYQNDLNAYISVIVQKASNSNTFYNQLINANSAFVNDAKAKYGIDLMNFKNLQEAKAKMLEIETKKVENSLNPLADFDSALKGIGANSGVLNNSYSKSISGYASKIAESIVDDFVSSSLSAVTNFHDFFKTGGSSSGGSTSSGNSVSSVAAEAVKAEDTLLKRYELAEAAYNRLVDKRIEKIQKEQEAREKAKDAEIAAIDEEIEARKRLTENRDIQKELNEVNARLTYDRLDELSRRELERKRQDLLNEQAEMFWQRNMSDKKDSIENSYSNYKSNSDAAMAELQRAAQSAAEYFDELKNGYKSNTQIVNNNSDTRNIQIISNALSNQQMLDKLLKAIYDK